MRVLLISQYFYPEQFKCNDVANELVKKGHEVTVLTGIPNYPRGRFFDGYGVFKRRHERMNGYDVYRALLVPRGNGGAIRLVLNYFSYAFFATFWAVWLVMTRKYDAILVHETSPITVGVPAVIAKKLRRIPMYFWVLDLWPESLTAAGGITNKYILGFFTKMTQWIYRNSEKILISSKGFEESIVEKGDFRNKLVYFPNWADRALEGKVDYAMPEMPTGFKVMFAGNIGEAQDFDHIMEAALILREHTDIHFILVGDGRKKPWVEDYVREYSLHGTVHCMGRHPLESMPLFFEQADAMLVTLKDEPIFNLTAPAKIQAYMSAGKPIVAMMNGEGPRLVAEADAGVSVAAGDASALANAILAMSSMKPEDLSLWGLNGKRYCDRHFNLDKCMNHLLEVMS